MKEKNLRILIAIFVAGCLILGLAAKMFGIAGPVIVYGISAGVIYGIICFAFGLY